MINKITKFCALAAITGVLLPALSAAEAAVIPGGLEVSITGEPWHIGNTYQDQVLSTSGNRWSVLGSSDGDEDIYAKVTDANGQTASTDGNNGADIFVLRAGGASGTVIPGTDVALKQLMTGSTYYLDLWFKAPNESSTNEGAHNLTVTLTAKNWETPIALNEVRVVDDNVIRIGTGGGHWLMWPRAESSPATNNNTGLMWKDENTAGQPAWNFTTKTYDYTAGGGPGGACSSHCTKANYPAFSWAEDLNWDGYTDWRLPTKDELSQLYTYRSTYVPTTNDYRAASEYSTVNAYTVSFAAGNVASHTKTDAFPLHAVRGSR